MKVEKAEAVQERLDAQLKELRLPTVKARYEALARQAEAETLSYERYLLNLCDQECQERQRRKIERLLGHSCLPLEKTFATFELKRLPTKVARQVQSLRAGDFVDRQENLLAFGKPGSGKTHLLCALAHELVHQGRRVLFTTCSLLVQGLLVAKRDLKLSRVLKRLAGYEVLLIDDLGYVQQDRAEMEVLFTLLAERYERGSVVLTSNLPFSGWESIFKDPMTTAAAIDRLVHHSVIIELNVPSYRVEQAKKRQSNHQSKDARKEE
jgi:DNA replication protein DnaC